jgi:hypothetical protein
VLVTQGNFKMKNIFSVALKPEMAGFDDSGVDRAHRDLVDLLALDPEKIGVADLGGRLPG